MEQTPRFVVLSRDLRFLRSSRIHPGTTTAEKAVSLTRALARSPIWQEMAPGSLVLRLEPVPALAALGRFDAADVARLEALAGWLEPAVRSVRYLDHAEVTAAVLRLADALRNLLGDAVGECDYAGIPRGGVIVQGLLSYALDLDGEALSRPADPARPLVVVDDCALTGSRFRRFVSGVERDSVIFAHLCSPTPLRAAMLDGEPRLAHAVAARDLEDLTPRRAGGRDGEWRAVAETRAGRDRYWIGRTEIPVFPWSEPDHNFWNPETGRTEWGWRLAAPERCLRNAVSGESAGGGVPVRIQDGGAGRFVLPPHVLAAPHEGTVFLLDSRTGATGGLEGVARDLWDGLMQGEPVDRLADRIAREHGVLGERVRTDVRGLVDELAGLGFLERRSGAGR